MDPSVAALPLDDREKMPINLISKFLKKDRVALARLISMVENHDASSLEILGQLHHKTGHAFVIGITGPPGAGKSTLISALITHIVGAHRSVGVLACDPSSPYTGGAVLGDRIRMQEHAENDKVYIRSISSRGSHGGLSQATFDCIQLLDAFGFDYVILETVGVGQSEVDIMKYADTTVLVLVPESGDSIQTMKAGIMEIADIYVINKSDRPGADLLQKEIYQMEHGHKEKPVLLTQASSHGGIEKLFRALQKNKEIKKETGLQRVAEQRRDEIKKIFLSELERRMDDGKHNPFEKIFKEVIKGKTNPYKAAQKIIKSIIGK